MTQARLLSIRAGSGWQTRSVGELGSSRSGWQLRAGWRVTHGRGEPARRVTTSTGRCPGMASVRESVALLVISWLVGAGWFLLGVEHSY
jgi:hypothetical protein